MLWLEEVDGGGDFYDLKADAVSILWIFPPMSYNCRNVAYLLWESKISFLQSTDFMLFFVVTVELQGKCFIFFFFLLCH